MAPASINKAMQVVGMLSALDGVTERSSLLHRFESAIQGVYGKSGKE